MRSPLLLSLLAIASASCTLPNTGQPDVGDPADVTLPADVNVALDVRRADANTVDVGAPDDVTVTIDVEPLSADASNADVTLQGIDAGPLDVVAVDSIVFPPEPPPTGIRVSSNLLALWATGEELSNALPDESILRPLVDLVAVDQASVTQGAMEGLFTSATGDKFDTLCDEEGSIEFWIEPGSAAGDLFRFGSLHLERINATTLRMNSSPDEGTSFGVPDNAPIHVVVTMDGTDARFRVNGDARTATLADVQVSCEGPNSIRLGGVGMRIRMLALYGRPLSPAEVTQNFEYGSRLVRRSATPEIRFPIDDEGETLVAQNRPIEMTINDEESQSSGSLLTHEIEFEDTLPQSSFANCVGAGAMTLEAWITPEDSRGVGPARIIDSASGGELDQQNFILAHGGGGGDSTYHVRISNTSTNDIPRWVTNDSIVRPELTHLVFVHSINEQIASFFINGQPVNTEFDSRGGGQPFAPYAFEERPFRIGSTLQDGTERRFQGQVHDVAVYCTALDTATVADHFHAGPGATR